MILTGAADNTARLWDCESGKEMMKFETNSAVRTCGFSRCGKFLMYSTDATMNNMCEISLYDIREPDTLIRYIITLHIQAAHYEMCN